MLEIGVGTGQLAVPLAARGVPVTGLDLSPAMLAQLRAKPGGAAVPLVDGDASAGCRSRDGAFDGAYARWVLHLIPDWEGVLDELIRVVGPAGPSRSSRAASAASTAHLFARYLRRSSVTRHAAGPAAARPRRAPARRDARARVGVRADSNRSTYERATYVREYFDDVPRRQASWTWRRSRPGPPDATARGPRLGRGALRPRRSSQPALPSTMARLPAGGGWRA